MINVFDLLFLIAFPALLAGQSCGSESVHSEKKAQKPTIKALLAEGPAP